MLRFPPFARRWPPRLPQAVAALALCALPAGTSAQSTGGTTSGATSASQPAAKLTAAEIRTLAETHVAVSVVNDSADARAAQSKNKTRDAQLELAHQKRTLVANAIKAKGLTEAEYQRQRFLVSTDADLRAKFDSVVAKITGAPLPGRVVAAAAPGFTPASALPPGLVGTHIGHVTTSYVDTPDKSGLLPMAFAEAQIAMQHANLALRTPMDLAAMQLHAGHVLHALDPALVPMGPGKGYGFRKAAGGVAQHIELAAKEPSASGNVKIHTTHIAGAARSALARMELAIDLARKIREAKDAAAAASLLGQLVSMCGQLISGADVNADGRIAWGDGEGGLQQAQEHLQLLLAGEKK
ncbi:MAG: hypothetical protein ACK54K_11235 [Gemmatimonadaceae bacterium]